MKIPPGLGRYRLHHVGIVVPNLERAVAGYSGAFELQETTLPFHDRMQRVRVAFVSAGVDAWLEFIEPLGADEPGDAVSGQNRGRLSSRGV